MLPTPRAEGLRPQVATVLQGISAMLEPTTFNAQNSNRTFVIALHENPALMLQGRIRLAVRRRYPPAFCAPETQLLPAQMENGDVDIYVGVNAVAHDAWVRRKLFDDEYATAQRKGHPRGTSPMDLDSYCSLSHRWFHPRATRSRALSISTAGLATSVT